MLPVHTHRSNEFEHFLSLSHIRFRSISLRKGERKERLVTRNHLGLYARENFPSINRSINVDMASMYVAVRLLSVSDKLITDGV